jgi:hypothetical protein
VGEILGIKVKRLSTGVEFVVSFDVSIDPLNDTIYLKELICLYASVWSRPSGCTCLGVVLH